ncbi:MAG TPA: hypothetical protein VJM31_01320 [Vicinamibacterales bacterium]|nr:hypothetical protein [Vicinamibacterales bacterium]
MDAVLEVLRDPTTDLAFKVLWPTLVSLVIFHVSRKSDARSLRREPLVEIVDALDKAEKAVSGFRAKYLGGYASDSDFISDASSAFTKCSAFLDVSKDSKKRLFLTKTDKESVDRARQNLVKELLAIQYDDTHRPFPHDGVFMDEVTAARSELEQAVRTLA